MSQDISQQLGFSLGQIYDPRELAIYRGAICLVAHQRPGAIAGPQVCWREGAEWVIDLADGICRRISGKASAEKVLDHARFA
jgi:hypothetical protein